MRFFYGDCGQLIGCDDPTYDLAAERKRRRKLAFERDMHTAIYTGEFYYRSSSPLSIRVQDAVDLVAQDPSPENIWKAQWLFDEYEARY